MFDVRAEYKHLASQAAIDWSLLEGKVVLVTGATGLIGSCCVRLLMERNLLTNSSIKVIAVVRNLSRARACFSDYLESEELSFVVADLNSFDQFHLKCDFIIHAGCPTASSFFMDCPVETAATIVDGTRNMLELARKAQVASFVYVSSMEVYGNGNNEAGLNHKLSESDVGYVDPGKVRSCYPEGKRMAEQFVSAYAFEYGVNAKVARLAQTFGPGIPKNDNRVFAQFARCALQKEDIVLRTTGASTRMYTYTTDAVVALFTILLKGEKGETYNVANESTYSSVREMAELVARENAHDQIAVQVTLDPDAPYPPEHHLPLNTAKLRALGWRPQVGLGNMYDNLMAYLED